MRVKILFKSTAFRLSLLYMGLFSCSVMMLLMFIYFESSKEMDGQIKQTINSQVGELSATFYQDGSKETIALLQDMMQHDTEGMSLYVFMNKKRQVLAGHLDKWPFGLKKDANWFTFHVKPAEETDEEEEASLYLGRVISFKGGYKLLVGYNLKHIEGIRTIIRNVLLGSLGLTLLVAVASSFVITRTISRKLEKVNQACWRVMHGNLEEKIPVAGGGDAFDTLSDNFNAMLAWISDLIKGIEEVSHNIAHDLRSPLSRLRNRLENIVSNEMDQARTREEIRTSIGEIDDLIQTFNAILRISQLEARAGIEHFTHVDVSEIAYDLIDFYFPLIEEKGLTLSHEISPSMQIHGDKHLIMQAFANLIDNAIKYSHHGGSIELSLCGTEQEIIFTLSDHGTGIPPAYHEKVKQRFFRLDTSRTTQGNGLGLSLVDAVVKLHGGHMVFADNNPGLHVTVTLPKNTAAAPFA